VDSRLDGHEDGGSCDLSGAAVVLGVSPTTVAQLLDRGILPWFLGGDGRHRRVSRAALHAHREERFALRQRLAQARRRPYASAPEDSDAMRLTG
jgi:excisionase family DNA binding protein